MTESKAKGLNGQLERLDEKLTGIADNQERQEKALSELFKQTRALSPQMVKLDTVVRMSMSEQKRINDRFQGEISAIKARQSTVEGAWEKKKEKISTRVRTTEKGMAFYGGGIVVILLLFDLGFRWVFHKFF